MLAWLISLFAGAASIGDVVNAARDSVVGLWNRFTGVFGAWAAAFIGLFNAAVFFTDRAWNLWFACLDYAQWVTFHAFPQWAGHILAQIVAWAQRQLAILWNDVKGAVAFAVGALTSLINTLRTTVTGWVNDIRATLGALFNRFRTIEQKVVALLTDPRALADWLAGQISQGVARWVVRNATFLGRLVLARATGLTTQAAQTIERVLTSLFL